MCRVQCSIIEASLGRYATHQYNLFKFNALYSAVWNEVPKYIYIYTELYV
jgi:hypothetical protein